MAIFTEEECTAIYHAVEEMLLRLFNFINDERGHYEENFPTENDGGDYCSCYIEQFALLYGMIFNSGFGINSDTEFIEYILALDTLKRYWYGGGDEGDIRSSNIAIELRKRLNLPNILNSEGNLIDEDTFAFKVRDYESEYKRIYSK